MSPSTLSLVSLAALSITSVIAQEVTGTFPPVPLASKHFEYDQIPYKVDTDTGLIRGFQTGYNICNSTTEGPESLCQTSFLNGPDDFCLWAPKDPDSVIANTEGEEVAWCTKPGHGTRLIPAGALKGIQFIKTPDYVQIVGFIDQTKINIQAGDYGGELDPHGADLRGNPMGGLLYSSAFGTDKNKYTQVIEWTNFMGGDAFCIKACDPAGPNAAHYCEHIYDRIGCVYNMPNNAKNGTFEACLGENQDFPGVYVENGVTMTYKQPGETEVPNPTYTPRIPASSSCTTYESQSLFSALGTPTAAPSASVTGSAAGSGSGPKVTGSGKNGSPTATGSGANASAASGNNNGAMTLSVSALSVVGVIFSAIFLS